MWRIRQFPGGEEFSLGGDVELIMSTKQKPWSRPPITIDFQVRVWALDVLCCLGVSIATVHAWMDTRSQSFAGDC